MDETIIRFIKFNADNGINTLLVYYDCRLTTLFESANWKLQSYDQRIEYMEYITENFLKQLGLVVIYDKNSIFDYPRWFIIKSENSHIIKEHMTHADIGKVLDMYCHNHKNYNSEYDDRFRGSIYINNNIEIYTEVANPKNNIFDLFAFEESLKTKMNKWNEVLSQYHIYCDYLIVKTYGLLTLKKQLHDVNFVKDNINAYINIIYNYIDGVNNEINKYTPIEQIIQMFQQIDP